MRQKIISKDPDILGSLPALRRAAKRAKQLAIATGTPFYVWQNGRVVDLNKNAKSTRKNARAKSRRSGG